MLVARGGWACGAPGTLVAGGRLFGLVLVPGVRVGGVLVDGRWGRGLGRLLRMSVMIPGTLTWGRGRGGRLGGGSSVGGGLSSVRGGGT